MKRFCTFLFCVVAVCLAPLHAQTWVNGQPATLVIGQNNFTGNGANFGGTMQGLSFPDGVVVGTFGGQTKLFVSDRNNHRVLRYNVPAGGLVGNYPTPDRVFGQTSLAGTAANRAMPVDDIGLNTPIGIAYNSATDELWVADFGNNRVVRFPNAIGMGANGPNANLVLGQNSFMTTTTGVGANEFNGPHNVALDIPNNKIYVADLLNNRVLRYDATMLMVMNTNAEVVFGQAGFGTNTAGLSQNQLDAPSSITIDGVGNLYVSDNDNHRVLRFDAAHLKVSGANADGVLGQPNFTSNATGLAANQFNGPGGLSINGTDLYVCDENNRRVLRFPNANTVMMGMPNANLVLGQQNFVVNNGAVQRTICQNPRYTFYHAATNRLYLTEGAAVNRVLVFDANLPTLTLNAASPLLAANTGTPTQVIAPILSQAMNTPTATNFFTFGGMTGLKAGTYAAAPSFTPTIPFQRGEVIEYTITTGATLGDGVSTNPGNKPYLNNITGTARATPFVGSFRTTTNAPAVAVNFVLSTFAQVGGSVAAIFPGDFDGDGYVDVAAFVPSLNRITVLRNLNWGNIAAPVAPDITNIPSAGMTDAKAADMNNDGRLDWVYTDGANVSYTLNTSTPGNLTSGGGNTLAVGGAPIKLETGDFNGDGSIDAAVVTATQLRVFRNNAGTFVLHSTTNLPGGETPTAIAKGDFNADGSLDIVIGYNTNNFRTYHNDGGGTMMETLVNAPTGGIPRQIVTGDINGVNGPDITVIVPNSGPSSVRVFLNDGFAGFAGSSIINVPNNAATSGGVAVGDIDGVNGLDIVSVHPQAAAPGYATWFTNSGGGVFGTTARGSLNFPDATAQAIALADLDGDGDLDAMVGFGTGAAFPYVAILRNEQQTTPTAFAPTVNAQNVARTGLTITQTFSTNMTTGTAQLVDAFVGGSGPMRVFGSMTGGRSRVGAGGTWNNLPTPNIANFIPSNLAAPAGANQFFPGEQVSVSIPNFQTNAAKNDRFVPITSGTATNLGGHVRQFRANVTGGAGIFNEIQRLGLGAGVNPRSVATADFNDDGRLDVIVANEGGGGSYSLALGGVGGVFSTPTTTGLAGSLAYIIAADFDNDGNADFAVSDGGINVFVRFGNGSGGFVSPVTCTFAGGNIYGVKAADMNGDGTLDIVAADANGNVLLFRNNGNRTFIAAPLTTAAANAFALAVGDIDRDGDMDVVATQGFGASNSIYILRNNGLGVLTVAQTLTPLAGVYDVDMGDFNNDTWLDIVVSQRTGNQMAVYFNNGAGAYPVAAPSATFATGTNPASVVVGDYDGDGRLDIITTNDGSNNISVFRWDNMIPGFTLFSVAPTDGNPRSWSAAGDFDNDGDLDFATANFGSNTVSILINAQPPRINSIPGPPVTNAASYRRQVVPERNSHTQAFGTFPVRVRFDQPVTSATASFPMMNPPNGDRGAIRIHGNMTGHRSTQAAQGTWNYIAGTNTAEYIPPAANPFRAGETVMVTVTNARANPALGVGVFSTSPTVYAFTVAPSGGTGRFIDSRRWDDAGISRSVALADFNLDGRIDMMQSSDNGLNLRLQNNPLGNPTSFANLATNIVGGAVPHTIAADFDSDGRPDIAYISGTNIIVRRNDPLGAFGTIIATIMTGAAGLNDLASADFDGDGDMDIALGANDIRVFLNNGNGTVFTLASTIGFAGRSLIALDADMDGDIDLAAPDGANNLNIYLNRGSNTALNSLFPVVPNFSIGAMNGEHIAFGDFNGDLFPDIVVGELGGNNLRVFLNQPMAPGTFVVAPFSPYDTGSLNCIPVVGLFDNDNILDIVVVKPNNIDSKVLFYRGNGAGGFTLEHSSAFMESTNLATGGIVHPQAADIDGDGDLDLVVPLLNGLRTAVLYNHQPELRVFTTTPAINANSVMLPIGINTVFNQNITAATAAIPVGNQGPIRIYGGMTGGRSTPATAPGQWTGSINSANFNTPNVPVIGQQYFPGEKVEFIASTNARIQGPPGVANTVPMTTGTVREFTVRAGVGPGTFFERTRTLSGVANAPEQTLLIDVNNDGRLDLVTMNTGSANFHVQFGNGNATFAAPTTVGLAGNGYRIASGDFDNDGDIDLVATVNGNDNIFIFTNTAGAFTLAFTVACNSAGGQHYPIVSDMNGDGFLDIVTGNRGDAPNPISIMFGLNNANFRTGATLNDPANHNADVTALGDVDNDGDIDVIMAAQGGGDAIVIYRNDGIGRLSTLPALKQIYAAGTAFAGLDIGDIDSDGDLDIVAIEVGTNTIRTFPNNPLGTFSVGASVSAVAGSQLRGLTLADVNGDTRPDVIVSSFTDSYIGVARNTAGVIGALDYFRGSVFNPRFFALGDVDGDGDLDIAAPNQTAPQDVVILLNATQPRFVCTAGCGPVTYTANISPQRNVNTAVAATLFTWQFTEPMTSATVRPTASFPSSMPGPSGEGGPIRVFGNMRASRTPTDAMIGSWMYNIAATTATLMPGRALAVGEEIMVSVSNAQATSGIAVRPYVYSFRARTGTGPGQFYEVQRPFIASNLFSSISTDIDNDTDADIVTVRPVDSQVQIFTNTMVNSGVFAVGANPATGGNPQNVIAADIDNDGDVDLITSNNVGSISILRNNPVGTFNLAVSPAVGANPRQLCAADFDGDGDLDIATANVGAAANVNNISVAFNNGSGNVFNVVGFGAGAGITNISNICAADVDSDGDMDIVASSTNVPSQVVVFINSGLGVFTPLLPVLVGGNSSGIVAGNFDADADIEFAISNSGNTNVNILDNNGSGVLNVSGTINVGFAQSHISSGDYDGDGDIDLVVSHSAPAQVTALRNMGGMFVADHVAGVTGNSPTALSMADYDGDGDLDIGVTNFTGAGGQSVSILLNATQPRLVCNSTSDCGPPMYTRAISPQRNVNTAPQLPLMSWQFTEQVTAATYTSIGAAQGAIRIFGALSSGQRNLAGSGTWAYIIATSTATFSPTRRFLPGEEVLVSMTSAQSPARVNVRPFVYNYRTAAGVGPAIFGNQEFSPYTTGANPQDVALGDVNGDGRVDMLVASGAGIVRRLNNGMGDFTMGNITFPTIPNPTGIALGDADNDGDLDIAVCNQNQISLLLNDGMGTFATKAGFPLGIFAGDMQDIQWSDLDGDGDLDMAAANLGTNSIRLVFNNDSPANLPSGFNAATIVNANGGPIALRLTDIDNDGDMDIAAANQTGTTGLAIMLNSGFGTFSAATVIPSGMSTPAGIAAGDIDADGDNDLILSAASPDVAVIYRNNGFGGFSIAGTNAIAANPDEAQLGDVDGDGDLDLLVVNSGANTATIWRNNGAGDFVQVAPGSPYGLGMQPLGVAFADLDGDGDLDFVSANSGSGTTSVMLNQGNAGLGFSTTNVGFTDRFNSGNRVIVSRAATQFNVGSFLGRTNLSNTSATVQYSIQAAAGGIAQFTMIGATRGTFDMVSSISTIATFVWRNAPVGGGSTQAVISVTPTFAGLLNATQITVTVIAEPAFPLALAYSLVSSTGTQGVNFGSFNQGQLLVASGRPFNLAFGAWNGWGDLAQTTATVRLRAFNTIGATDNFLVNSTASVSNFLNNASANVFQNLTIRWLNAPETAISTQVTLRLVTEGPTMLATTSVTLTLTRLPLDPQITSFSPSTGGTGTIITVQGLTLTNVTVARIAGVPVQSFTVNSANQITLVAAAGTSGTITLSNSFGTGESAQQFTFVQFPTIIGVQPARACAGQVLTITGTNLEDVQRVFMGSQALSSFRLNERGQIEVTVPPNAESGIVTVLNRAGTATGATVLVPTPQIFGIQPQAVGTGGTITVVGTNMQAVVNATLGMNTLSILAQNSTTLTLRVATTAQVSTAPLSLESGSGCVVLSTQAISIAAPPTVTGISTSMPEVGQTFVLTGTNFVPGTIVTLGGITAASVEVVSPTEIRVAFGMNALAAAAQGAPLQVITPFGTAVFMDGLIRLLPQTVIPTGIDFTPERGTQNSTVTITGRGFIGVRQVFFGTTPALSFRVESPERIVAIVSTGATGVVRVSSTTGTGESMRIFTFVSPQELDSIAALTLFRATNGMNWTTNANWTNPRASYTTWFGLTIPASGANAGRITAITLPANGLTGSVTNAIIALSQMSALQSVNLSGNTALGGTLGSVVAGLRSVRSLNLANTGLQGRLPLELGLLDSLEVLKLDSNRLEGTIADVYCTVFGLTQRNFSLREMRLASNSLTGEIPPCIVQFTRLQVLRLENNQFIGRIPEGINRLAQLREFVLARNNLTGQLPRSLDSTTFTAFAGKPVNGNGAETQALTQLEIFDVSNNQLSGTVPNGIAQSRNMKTLLLNNNAFTGTLPETLPSLGFLERFNASNNQFSGEIWEGVGMMRSLREFAVRNNRLSGTIPSTFTQIPTLQRLELDNNALTGDVPTDLNRLGTMRVLGLSGNRLRTAPSFVGLRQTLDSLRLERNMLTFESIEPSMQVQNFTYSPQDSVGVAESRFFRVGSRIPLQFSVGGEFNRYQWFQNGRAVTPLQESPSFVLTENALIEQSGVYECRITNGLARGLTLFARPLTIRIDTAAPTSPDVLGNQVAAPVLVFPYPAGRNMPYSLPLRWRNAEGASVYEVQFSLLNDFSILVTNATLSSTSLSVSALRPGTRYHWRVRSIGSEGQRSVWVSDFFTTGVNDKPMQMTSVDFGRVSLADTADGEALIVNFSNVAQTLQEITLDDPNLSFSVLDNVLQTVIPAEKFITVKVRFAPRSTGVKLATSILRYNESLRPERTDSVQNILQGTGVALKLTNVDFDTVRAGGTTIKSALLINTSPRAVRVGAARAVNTDGGNVFSVESYLGDKNFDLKPNDTLAIVVRCTPPNVGRKFAGLLVLGDNESVTANIRAVARTFRDGDVIVSFGIRPERDSIAPGGSVGVQLYIKADARTRNLTTDLLRAVQPRYQARFRFNPEVLTLDRSENRARQQVLNSTAFVSIPVTQWNFDVNNLTARELPLLTLRGLSISGSTTSTLMQIESASWEPLTMGSSAAIFVEAPINSTFNSLACVAGGTRLTTTAERNALAVSRPNPVKDVAEVQYSLREDGNIALSMIDMSGKQVAVLAEGYADAGRYSVMLSVQAIPSGAYFLVLQTPSGIVRQRVDVVK